ncbi:uncharacterized [Tachysurus ichikawai]
MKRQAEYSRLTDTIKTNRMQVEKDPQQSVGTSDSGYKEQEVCLLPMFQEYWSVFHRARLVKPCGSPVAAVARHSRDIIMGCLMANIKQLSPGRPESRDHFSHYTDHQTCSTWL